MPLLVWIVRLRRLQNMSEPRYCILLDLAGQHLRRAAELQEESARAWIRREVQPAVESIWAEAIRRNSSKTSRPTEKI
jgi:hypothetical protein